MHILPIQGCIPMVLMFDVEEDADVSQGKTSAAFDLIWE